MTAVHAFHNTSARRPATEPPADPEHLPPPGASPAGDLQRRVSEEVSARPSVARGNAKLFPRAQWAIILGLGSFCWTVIAGVATLLRA